MPSVPKAGAGTAADTGASMWRWLVRHERWATAFAYALVLVLTYSNVVFLGDSLVYSNNLNLLDHRTTVRSHGPGFRPSDTWTNRNLMTTANLHDPGATWTQWETGGIILRRSLREGDLPFWDSGYSGGGVPAMANLIPAFFFPPYLLLVALGNGVMLKNVYFLGLLLTAAWCTSGASLSSGTVVDVKLHRWPHVHAVRCADPDRGIVYWADGVLPAGRSTRDALVHRASHLEMAAAGLAVVYGSIALASFPPLLLAVFGLSAVYAIAGNWHLGTKSSASREALPRFALFQASRWALGWLRSTTCPPLPRWTSLRRSRSSIGMPPFTHPSLRPGCCNSSVQL